MAFEKNEVRQFPTKKDFLGEKKMDGRVYGYMQTNSYLTKEKVRYCFKSEMSAKKIKNGLEKNKKDDEKKGLSESTIRNMIKLLSGANLISEETISNKKVYIIVDLQPGEYVFVKTKTLEYLINSSNENTIKVYAFLKQKYEVHKKKGHEEQYRFSEDKILEILGYNNTKAENHRMVQHILNSLANNNLIKYHKYPVDIGGKKIYYRFLDAVYDDYNDEHENNGNEDSYTPVITPREKTYEEFAKEF